jgi:hypothetical protein
MPRSFSRARLITASVLLAVIILPVIYISIGQHRPSGDDPIPLLNRYLRAIYARDYKEAYSFISSRDRQVKAEQIYVRERGAFHGFTLEVAQKLAGFIDASPLETQLNGDQARIKLGLKLPDAGGFSSLLLDWDEERLNTLPAGERRKMLQSIDRLNRDGKITMIEGAEEFTLVKENGDWKIFLDWAAGVRVSFDADVPAGGVIEATPIPKETRIQTSELFTIAYKVKNLSPHKVSGRIVHRVEPEALARHLDLVECALLIPVRLSPGKEEEYSSTYLLRGDLPEGARELHVTYEFKVEP